MGNDDGRDLFPEFSYTRFEIVRRGYARDQVDDEIDSLHADLQIVTADRDAVTAQAGALARQLDHARRELDEARTHIHRLNRAPASTAGMSERLQKMMQIAQDEAAEIRARAAAEASEILDATERDTADVKAKYLEAIAELDRIRQSVEREQEEAGRARAEAHVAAAEQRSRALVEEARARAEQLRSLRAQIADQLLAARRSLDSVTRELAPVPDEETVLLEDLPRRSDPHPDEQAGRPKAPTASRSA